MTVALALVSSLLFGAGVALQQRPASSVPVEYAARPGLLVRAAQQPAWIAGIVLELAAFVTLVAALRHGSLVVVQPLLTLSLLFTISLASVWTHQAMHAADWAAVIAVVGGLAVFLAVAHPSEHSSGMAAGGPWFVTVLSIAGAIVALVLVGLHGSSRHRAAALGLAAGLGDAMMAVLTKAFAHLTEHGIGAVLTSWTTYALCVAGLTSLLLTQTAYQVGQPKVSLPIITVTDPLVSCAIGVALFGEVLHLGGFRGPAVFLAISAMGIGLAVLGRTSSEDATAEPAPSA
jgi:drug/metabolite transporter (DMT)-like permease